MHLVSPKVIRNLLISTLAVSTLCSLVGEGSLNVHVKGTVYRQLPAMNYQASRILADPNLLKVSCGRLSEASDVNPKICRFSGYMQYVV